MSRNAARNAVTEPKPGVTNSTGILMNPSSISDTETQVRNVLQSCALAAKEGRRDAVPENHSADVLL